MHSRVWGTIITRVLPFNGGTNNQNFLAVLDRLLLLAKFSMSAQELGGRYQQILEQFCMICLLLSTGLDFHVSTSRTSDHNKAQNISAIIALIAARMQLITSAIPWFNLPNFGSLLINRRISGSFTWIRLTYSWSHELHSQETSTDHRCWYGLGQSRMPLVADKGIAAIQVLSREWDRSKPTV